MNTYINIILAYLAAKIRTFGQYTAGDILEERYGPVARVFGALANTGLPNGIVVSLFTKKPSPEVLAGFFPKKEE